MVKAELAPQLNFMIPEAPALVAFTDVGFGVRALLAQLLTNMGGGGLIVTAGKIY
jgi:hypothetical protein